MLQGRSGFKCLLAGLLFGYLSDVVGRDPGKSLNALNYELKVLSDPGNN